jgi:hypothetical protein
MIEQRRSEILAQMEQMRSLHRGTLNAVYKEQVKDGKATGVRYGPYYVLSRNVRGKTKSRNVASREVDEVRAGLEQHTLFRELCDEYEELTQRLGELERNEEAAAERQKKGL